MLTCAHSGDVITFQRHKLVDVGKQAFDAFKGTITITGTFPMWKSVGPYAFYNAGTADSKIDLQCRADTWTTGGFAFTWFKGTSYAPRGPLHGVALHAGVAVLFLY